MKILLKQTLCTCAALLAMASVGKAQKRPHADGRSNIAVVIVGSAAKSAWVTTRFTAKHVAKPVAKTIFAKALPRMTVYGLKKSPVIAKKIAPYAIKIALL